MTTAQVLNKEKADRIEWSDDGRFMLQSIANGMPANIHWTCQVCGNKGEFDLSKSAQLVYALGNDTCKIYTECQHCEKYHELSFRISISFHDLEVQEDI